MMKRHSRPCFSLFDHHWAVNVDLLLLFLPPLCCCRRRHHHISVSLVVLSLEETLTACCPKRMSDVLFSLKLVPAPTNQESQKIAPCSMIPGTMNHYYTTPAVPITIAVTAVLPIKYTTRNILQFLLLTLICVLVWLQLYCSTLLIVVLVSHSILHSSISCSTTPVVSRSNKHHHPSHTKCCYNITTNIIVERTRQPL